MEVGVLYDQSYSETHVRKQHSSTFPNSCLLESNKTSVSTLRGEKEKEEEERTMKEIELDGKKIP